MTVTHPSLPKFCRFHFLHLDSETVIESNEVLLKGNRLKFERKFWIVVEAYMEIQPDGNGIYHHICALTID